MFFPNLLGDVSAKLNPLYTLRDECVRSGAVITDLVSGNVNQQGITFPHDRLSEIFGRALSQAKNYQPDSLGQLIARESIAEYYQAAGLALPASQILLTPGTSVSYLYCFKLLAEPGAEIICPRPSYPLFDTIARLAEVRLTSYRLSEPNGWEIDLDYLESRLTTQTRAIIVISPHNPTGMVATQSQLEGLAEIARRHQLAVISDEVFSEFVFDGNPLPRPAFTSAPLVLTLNGFSKMFALPGMKLGWVAVNGDSQSVSRAMWTLEMVSDTFLPVNEMVQFAVPAIFRQGRDFLAGYQNWVQCCRDTALEALSNCPALSFSKPQGGFYLTLKVTVEHSDEEALVIDLLRHTRVLLHPGYFYDIEPSHLVMTFVLNVNSLKACLSRVAQRLSENRSLF